MVRIHEISKDTITELGAKFCVENRNEIYFLAHENTKEKPISVLWSDLTFLRKFFGVELHNENSDITNESLNDGRIYNIEIMRKCIDLNVCEYDVRNYLQDDGTYGMMKNYYYNKPNPNNGNMIDLRKEVERKPRPLTKLSKKRMEEDIARGLYVICKYV